MKKLTYGIDIHKGDICVYIGSEKGRYIIRVLNIGHCDKYIDTSKSFYRTGGSCSGTWVEATPLEKLWLETCIKEDRTIPIEEIKLIEEYEIY